MAESLRLCSFNMHGFNNGFSMLKTICLSYDIILLQETWLLESNLFKLNQVNNNFQSFSLSSMNNKVASGILTGRPFGGTSILWNKKLAHRVQILNHDTDDGRFISIEISGLNVCSDIIITCVYLPCVSTSSDYVVVVSNITAHLEAILDDYPEAEHIIAGDFNFYFDASISNVGFNLMKDIISDYNLLCCDCKVSNNISYTYVHESLNQRSWLDHFIVSNNLFKHINTCDIIDSSENLSDHLPITCHITLPISKISPLVNKPVIKRVCKERWDQADLMSYYFNSGNLLQSINVPLDLLMCSVDCNNDVHKRSIDDYYLKIVKLLKLSAVGCVPKIPHKALKPFWDNDLDRLKEISCDMHSLWRSVGSPRVGIINAARISAKLDYKRAIRNKAAQFEQRNADDLNRRLADKDVNGFWKCWNAHYQNSLSHPVAIDSHSDDKEIADIFSNVYKNVYIDSNNDMAACDEFKHEYSKLSDLAEFPFIDVNSIQRCVNILKTNKAAGFDGLVAEHIINSHPAIILHLKFLFTMFLKHSYVPEAFGFGLIVPVIKDKRGQIGSSDNYRPITLSPIISKLFESLLLEKYSHLLVSDDLQFGFKNSIGCSNAVFALRQCVEYFNNRGSNVYIASLDASKAFDRVNFLKLFSALAKNGLPKFFIDTIINWYGKLSSAVKWNGQFSSSPFKVTSGVRQGGILSPIFFNLYINSLICKLRIYDYGCHVRNLFLGCILYADDLLLLSASVLDLQKMLDVCSDVGSSLSIIFNAKKSMCIKIGPNRSTDIEPMFVNNCSIQWVNSIKYLGLNVLSGKSFDIDFSEQRRKFFISVNSILNKCTFTSDIVKLELAENHCLPILMYCIEATNVNSSKLRELNSWWNSVYRKIFGYNKWESVKILINQLGRLDLHHIVNLKRILFIKRSLMSSNNSVVAALLYYYRHGRELKELEILSNSQIFWSVSHIKASMYSSFDEIASKRTS